MTRKLKEKTVNLLISVGSIVSIFLITEIGLRFTPYKSVLSHYKYPKGYYQNNSEYGFDITPNFPESYHVLTDISYKVWSNELGCFDKPYNTQEPFVFLTGDSFTWGYAPYEQKFGTMIEDFLDIRVLKCGVSGFGSKQQLLKSKSILSKLKQKPKLFIVGYFIGNDFEDDYSFPNYAVYDGYRVQVASIDAKTGVITRKENVEERYKYFAKYCTPNKPGNPAIERATCFAKRNSILFNLFKGRLRTLLSQFVQKNNLGLKHPAEKSLAWENNAYRRHLKNITEINTLANSYGSKLLIVVIPTKAQIYPSIEQPSESNNQHALFLIDFLTQQNINFLDLTPIFQKFSNHMPNRRLKTDKDLYLPNDHHWTIKGNTLAGLAISKHILENNLYTFTEISNPLSSITDQLRAEFGDPLSAETQPQK